MPAGVSRMAPREAAHCENQSGNTMTTGRETQLKCEEALNTWDDTKKICSVPRVRTPSGILDVATQETCEVTSTTGRSWVGGAGTYSVDGGLCTQEGYKTAANEDACVQVATNNQYNDATNACTIPAANEDACLKVARAGYTWDNYMEACTNPVRPAPVASRRARLV